MIPSLVTVAFSTHRPETSALTAASTARHEAIVLEEPPDPRLKAMLDGRLGIEEYLLPLDLEYPEFSRALCALLRNLHREGRRIYQVEPFLEVLIEIHERFAAGAHPASVDADPRLAPVYRAEKKATGALLGFYEAAGAGDFDETVAAVKRFARADAERFRLRDELRAEAVAAITAGHAATWVEAGEIHQALWSSLRRRLAGGCKLQRCFVLAPVYRATAGRPHLFGPGDLLTLRYVFRPDLPDRPMDDRLAAASLVYNKLLSKEEIVPAAGAFPHTRNEIDTIRFVRRLSLEGCRRLFTDLHRVPTRTAQRMVGGLSGPPAV